MGEKSKTRTLRKQQPRRWHHIIRLQIRHINIGIDVIRRGCRKAKAWQSPPGSNPGLLAWIVNYLHLPSIFMPHPLHWGAWSHDLGTWSHDPGSIIIASLGSIITWFVEHYHLVLLLCLWSIITRSREKGLGTKLHTWAVSHSQYSLRKFGQSCFTTHHIWVNLQLYLLPFPFFIFHFSFPTSNSTCRVTPLNLSALNCVNVWSPAKG